MRRSTLASWEGVADRARASGAAYLGGFLVTQLAVFAGFWLQIRYPGSNLLVTGAVTLAFEVASIYCAFRLYQLRHPT